MIDGFREFEFDLPEALLAKLITEFDGMSPAPLLGASVAELPEAQGVYQLLYENRIVYVGKTDGEAGLRQRLTRHAWTIQHRCNLDASAVLFRALRVYVFTAIDLETQLIRHYSRQSKVSWNKSGFGSNDPGRQRDTTKIKPGGFDQVYPVDLDRPIEWPNVDGPVTVAKALGLLKAIIPYTIRSKTAGRTSDPHPDLMAQILLPSGQTSAREVIKALVAVLPTGWQATLLPGRVILYQEDQEYSAGSIIAVS